MAVITISRLFGSGGLTLGKRLAQKLDYRLIHDHLIREVANKARVTRDGVEAFEQGKGSRLIRFLDSLVKLDYVERLISERHGVLNEERYITIVSEMMDEVSREGNAVIIGRGGQFMLRERPGVYHILLMADMDWRIKFISAKYGLSQDEAAKTIRQHDQQRELFLETFGGNPNDASNYHLMINTGLVGLEQSEKLIAGLVE